MTATKERLQMAAAAPEDRLHVALRDGLSIDTRSHGDLHVLSPFGSLVFKQVSPGLRAAMEVLANGGSTIGTLSDLVLERDGSEPLYRFYYHFEQLRDRGMIQHTVMADGSPVMTIMGVGPGFSFAAVDIQTDRPYRLSRFACCRRGASNLIVESPTCHAQIELHDWRAGALIAVLAAPVCIQDLAGKHIGLDEEALAACFGFLANAKMLTDAAPDSISAEDDDPVLAQWSFHDLLFHSRSRFGRHAGPFGATFRHADRIDPLPAVKPPPDGPKIGLVRPDLATLQTADPPLARVMETRRSVYTYAEEPITLAQLGAFLYRVARVRTLDEAAVPRPESEAPMTMQVSSRPYPAGGRCYELEFYVTANRCAGLSGGLYHYDPLNHNLTRLRTRDDHVEALLRYCTVATNGTMPQVLITLAARFQRVSWKYDAIAYATILKHVGVAYQTMYLAATAMGLAPCALGSGDADLFAAAAGTDYLVEGSVGDFMLGSLPTNGTTPAPVPPARRYQ